MDQTPTSPGSSRPRPRSRGISFASNRSGESQGSKLRAVESPSEKARRDSLWKGATKANPNAAINESQPGEANLLEQSTLQNLREYRHRDAYGNVISDPDLSNPTRPRLERPLDTIRSFEKAIDEGYKRRSTYKPEPEQWDQNNQFASRRSSYFGGYDNGPSPNRHAQQQQQGGYYGNQNGGPQRSRYGNRMQSDPQTYNQQKQPYPQHGYHQSHDTVNTGYTNGSDSTGPWANSTDPSSENSSLDRVNAMNKPQDPHGAHHQNGYNGPIMEEQGAGAYGDYPYQDGYGQQQQQYGGGQGGQGGPRDNYRRHNTAPNDGRRPMQLNGGNSQPPPAGHLPSNKREPEKRKSWLARRFSKNG